MKNYLGFLLTFNVFLYLGLTYVGETQKQQMNKKDPPRLDT